MPLAILAAIPAPVIAGILATLGVLIVLAPFALPVWLKHVDEKNRIRLRDATAGIFNVLSVIAPNTPTTIDDQMLKLVELVQKEVGKTLSEKEKLYVKNVGLSLQADPNKPTLKDHDGATLKIHTI